MLEILISLFLLIGAAFALIGSIGLARLPDLFMRLHGPTKATTLGVGGILIASTLHFSSRGDGLSLHELLVSLFLLSTAPISAFLIARAMLHLRGESANRRGKSRSKNKMGNPRQAEIPPIRLPGHVDRPRVK